MMIETRHLQPSDALTDEGPRGGLVAELLALLRAMTHHPVAPEPDTSIAWEDGEADDTTAADGR
jgi:hypothetical protein